MRVGTGQLGRPEPIPADIYKLECVSMEENEFNSGAWGFNAQFSVARGDYNGRRIFDSFPILDVEGRPSGALFRFVQTHNGLVGELPDAYFYDSDDGKWYDGPDSDAGTASEDEVKEFYREAASQMVNFEGMAEVDIEEGVGEYEGRNRNRIKKWT